MKSLESKSRVHLAQRAVQASQLLLAFIRQRSFNSHYYLEAICSTNTALSHPGEQTQNTQTHRHTDYYNPWRPARLGLIMLYSGTPLQRPPLGNTILAVIQAYRGGGFVLYTNCSFGTWVPGRYTEVAFIEGFHCTTVLTLRSRCMMGFVRWCSLATALVTSEKICNTECSLIIADSANTT